MILAACGLGEGEPGSTELRELDTEPATEQVYSGQNELGSTDESVPAVEDEPDDHMPATEPAPSEPANPETLELRERFLASLRGEGYKQEKDRAIDAEVEMRNPVYARARLNSESRYALSFDLFVSLWHANPSWWVAEGPEAPPVWDQYQEMILDLDIDLLEDTYQYRYYYHDDVWEAVRWPEGQIPFCLEYAAPYWSDTAKEYGDFIEGDEIFSEEDFFAIYRELGLENDGGLANLSRVIERLGMPERFFLRYDEGMYSDFHLYLRYSFGEVSFQDITLVKLTDDSVSGPRGTRVGDRYEDVIAKFPREENREDNYLYQVDVYVTDGPMPPHYVTAAEGISGYNRESDGVFIVRYRNGRGNVEYEIKNDVVVSISTYMLIDGW
jgi:hypothetical protein